MALPFQMAGSVLVGYTIPKVRDLRFAKLVQFGNRRLNVGLDVFNALNSDVVLTSNNTFGSAWLTPTSVQTARQLQGSVRLDF